MSTSFTNQSLAQIELWTKKLAEYIGVPVEGPYKVNHYRY